MVNLTEDVSGNARCWSICHSWRLVKRSDEHIPVRRLDPYAARICVCVREGEREREGGLGERERGGARGERERGGGDVTAPD